MSFLLNTTVSSQMQNQARNLQGETSRRASVAKGLQQIQVRFSGLVTEIESASAESAELLQKLKPNNPSTDQKSPSSEKEEPSLEVLSKLVSFVSELKKADSLEKLYPTVAALKAEARGIEAEAAQLE